MISLIESNFYATQIICHRDFNLTKLSCRDLKRDGTQNVSLVLKPIVIKQLPQSIELVIKDKDGNVVSDPKQKRLDRQKQLSQKIRKHSDDKTLKQMLNSYTRAVKNPNHELVHLYEIRDTLSTKFGSQQKALDKLKNLNTIWRRLGHLANNASIKEGRHPGKALGNLRHATKEELELARNCALKLIEGYLDFLENNS